MDINSFKQGDFVFAKMKGYRAWPARIIQPVGRMFNVFFYGTCNTAVVGVKYLYPYGEFKSRLGILKNTTQTQFKRAMEHVDIMYEDPTRDMGFKFIVANLGSCSEHTDDSDLDLDEEIDEEQSSPLEDSTVVDDDATVSNN